MGTGNDDDTRDDAGNDAGGGDEGKTFTQAELDRIVEQRLKRERGKFSDYDDLKAKAEQLDELEAENRSDVENATTRAEQAEKRAAAAERRALVLEVATERGLTADQAKRLQGDSRDELEADADELLNLFSPAGGDADDENDEDGDEDDGDKPGPRRPAEKLTPGASSTDDDDVGDASKIAERALGSSII